jgi:hypothetical protein
MATATYTHARARFERELRNLSAMLSRREVRGSAGPVFVGRNAESSTRTAAAKLVRLRTDLDTLDDQGNATDDDWRRYQQVERTYVVLAQPRKYLGGKPRELIAAWIIEYRHFIAANPNSELTPTLVRCIADARLALRQRRAVDRLTGWTRAKAHAVSVSVPCTPHSVAGRRSA